MTRRLLWAVALAWALLILALAAMSRRPVQECRLSSADLADLCSDRGDEVADLIQEHHLCALPPGWRGRCND